MSPLEHLPSGGPTGAGARLAAAGARRPVALVWLGVLLYSTGPVMVGASSVSGPVLSFWRLWIGVVVMGAATLVHVRVSGRVPDRTGWSWAARAGVAFGLHQLAFMSAIKATSVVDVTLMQVLAPMFVAVLAIPLFGERPGVTFRLWSLVAVLGAATVVLAGASGPEGAPLGMALAVLNVGFFAVYFVWSKRARDHIDVVPFLLGVVVAAGLTVTAYVVVAGEAPGSATGRDLALAAAIALVPGALGHFVSTWPLRWLGANVPPVIQLTMPFLAGGLAWLVLGQVITPLHLLGGLVTVAGVAGAVLSPSGRRLAAARPLHRP
ncbi:MAG TPA: DMT family transporter [Acidimicrobiales bacterium]|nr:DMT family transporter [Acidimicrobiales bacterium]